MPKSNAPLKPASCPPIPIKTAASSPATTQRKTTKKSTSIAPTSTTSCSSAPPASRCIAKPTSSTCGSTPAQCHMPRFTIPLKTKKVSTRAASIPPTSLPKVRTRPADGSSPSTQSPAWCSTPLPIKPSFPTDSCSTKMATKCQNASATPSTPSRQSKNTAPTPCAGT